MHNCCCKPYCFRSVRTVFDYLSRVFICPEIEGSVTRHTDVSILSHVTARENTRILSGKISTIVPKRANTNETTNDATSSTLVLARVNLMIFSRVCQSSRMVLQRTKRHSHGPSSLPSPLPQSRRVMRAKLKQAYVTQSEVIYIHFRL